MSSNMEMNPIRKGERAPPPPLPPAAGSLAAEDGQKADAIPETDDAKSHFHEHKHKYGIGAIGEWCYLEASYSFLCEILFCWTRI